MDEVIHVEILGRLGDVAHRITLHHLPVRIGRAYDNDVIVDDPYVAPHHLRVERDADGALHAVDLGSRNGLHLLDPVRRVANTPVGGGERLRIGHTPLRIRARDFAVPAELPDPNADRRRSPLGFVATLALYLAALGFAIYGETTERFEVERMLAWIPLALLVPAAWAGLWSGIGRLVLGRAHFFLHLTHTALWMAGVIAMLALVRLLAFALSIPLLADLDMLALAGAVGLLIYGHLRLTSRQARRVLAGAAAAIVLLSVGGLTLSRMVEARKDVTSLDAMTVMLPPWLRVVPGEPIEPFVEGARGLEAELKALRETP